MHLHIHRLDTSQATATLGPVVIRVVRSARTEESDLDFLRVLTDEALAKYPASGMWVVVHHGAPIPSGPVRRYTGQVFTPYKERMSLAYSMLGLGFWASAARAASSVLAKLVGANAPTTTSVEEGAHKLSMDLVGVDPEELVAAHDALLERMQLVASAA